MKGWLNIFNPTFTLHLLEETVAETWVTRKPTADGHVTSPNCLQQTVRKSPSCMGNVRKASQNRSNGVRKSTR